MSNFNLIDCGKQLNFFKTSNTNGSIEKNSNFQSVIDLPTSKLTIENMSSFDFVNTLIIQVKWLLLIELNDKHWGYYYFFFGW